MELSNKQNLLQTIVNRAWEDEAFKKDLINNPIEAIEKLTGEKVILPKGKELVVRDQTDEEIVYINIPAEQNMADVELNEEQLEIVAGGGTLPWINIPDLTTMGGEDMGGGPKR